MNRRVRNRTHGGVEEGRHKAPPTRYFRRERPPDNGASVRLGVRKVAFGAWTGGGPVALCRGWRRQ